MINKKSWLGRWAAAAILALGLSACGMTPPGGSAQTFIRDHTECPASMADSPNWSPDGGLIYYYFQMPSVHDLRVVSSDGTNDRLLLHDGLSPRLSPDGTMILFQRPDWQTFQARDFLLYDIATQDVRLVVKLGDSADWSRDSAWLVYGTLPMVSGPIYKINLTANQAIPLTDTTGGAKSRDLGPLWSPDGKRIAFSSDRDGLSAVYIMDADGQGLRQIERADAPACGPGLRLGEYAGAWSPDGSMLAVRRTCDVGSTLRIVDVSGVELASWGDRPEPVLSAEWSPDGTSILYSSKGPQGDTLSIAALDGSGARPFKTGPGSGHWSPDGAHIVYSAPDETGSRQIFIAAADGSAERQITRDPNLGKVCWH